MKMQAELINTGSNAGEAAGLRVVVVLFVVDEMVFSEHGLCLPGRTEKADCGCVASR